MSGAAICDPRPEQEAPDRGSAAEFGPGVGKPGDGRLGERARALVDSFGDDANVLADSPSLGGWRARVQNDFRASTSDFNDCNGNAVSLHSLCGPGALRLMAIINFHAGNLDAAWDDFHDLVEEKARGLADCYAAANVTTAAAEVFADPTVS